jgi:acyl-CoA dehydrogenase
VRAFIQDRVVPEFAQWEANGLPPRTFYTEAGTMGLPGIQVPEEFGGGGESSFKFNCVLNEESQAQHVHLGSLRLQMDVVLPYLLAYATPEQKQRWLPGIAQGTILTAIAMTEPGTGSDLAGIRTTAVRSGDHYVLNGAKTFITGGSEADLVLVVARTTAQDGNRRGGLSILAVDATSKGFQRGARLDKIGLKAQDTSELHFEDVMVPVEDLLGEQDVAFDYLTSNLPQERLTIAVAAQAMAVAALATTLTYVRDREAFGVPVASFQNTKFVLAECHTEIAAGQALVDQAIDALDAGELSDSDAAAVKLYTTELQSRVVDKCLQLHGGYGFIREFPIARQYTDARVSRIYGGTSEVMKLVIAKELHL